MGESKSYSVINSSTANAFSRNPYYYQPLAIWVSEYKTWTPLPVPEPHKGERKDDAE